MDWAKVPLEEIHFLTAKEAAARLRVSNMTIYRLCDSGELESVRAGGSRRIPAQAVDEYQRNAFVAVR